MDIDLEINNYSINDIEKFFRFRKNQKYNAADIELRECEIREQLLSSGHIDKKFKRDLIEFLTEAKQWLIYTKCNVTLVQNTPTTVPKNAQLDTSNVPRSREEAPSREGELLKRPETQYMHTNNSEYFQGTMNPLNTRVITKCLSIDTRFRTNLYSSQSSDFMLQLPTKLSKVVSMQMSSLEFPVAFYGISTCYGNNYFHITISHMVEGVLVHETKLIVVPDGNYNANDLIYKINSILSPKDVDGGIIYPTSIFSYVVFSVDVMDSGSGTGKVLVELNADFASIIANIHGVTLDFSKDMEGNDHSAVISTKIGWNLGFIYKLYEGKLRYVSESIIEPAAIRYIYLAIDDFNNSVNNHFVSAFENSVLNPNILARISIRGTYFSLIMDNDLNIVTEPRKYFGPVDIQRLHIRLFDDHGRILNMNNSNFSFCLNFKIMYDL